MAAITAEYACILGISRPTEGLKPGEIHRTWGKGFTTFVNVGKENQVFWFIFTKMDRKYQYTDIPKFSKEDLDAKAKSFLDTHLCPGVNFGAVYENAISSSFVPLQEGVCKSWSWGRFACLGDAIHKVCPTLPLFHLASQTDRDRQHPTSAKAQPWLLKMLPHWLIILWNWSTKTVTSHQLISISPSHIGGLA